MIKNEEQEFLIKKKCQYIEGYINELEKLISGEPPEMAPPEQINIPRASFLIGKIYSTFQDLQLYLEVNGPVEELFKDEMFKKD